MTDWKETTLGELIKSGFVLIHNNKRTPLSSEVRSKMQGQYPYYGAASAIDSVNSYKFDGSFLLIAEDGTVFDGKAPMLQLVNGKFWVSNHSHVLQGKDQQATKLLYYILKNVSISPYITGAVQPKLTKENLNKITFSFPENELEQKMITGILGSLDDKIELLRKENETLEKLAQTLFKRWFVDFEFPADSTLRNQAGGPVSSASPTKGGEGGSVRGYKSSGGKMIDSKLGRIPEGWRAGSLGDCLSLEYGKPLKEEDRTGRGYPVYGSNGVVGYHKDYFVEGEGIVVGRKGSMGALEWVEDNFFPIDTAFYVKDRLNINKLFFHFLLLQRQDLKKVGSDSAVPGLNRNAAYSIDVVVPNNIIIKTFHNLLTPIFQKRKNNNDQIKSLSVSRDILLPWLMNGLQR